MKNRIKEILKERGMSQKELCSLVGMSEAGLSNAINGTATLPTIAKVAAALGVDSKDLLVDDELVARFSAEKTPLMLGDIALPCYVLNNGMRVFSGRGIQKAIGASQNTSGSWLQKFVNSDAIVWNILPGVLDKFNTPVKFKHLRYVVVHLFQLRRLDYLGACSTHVSVINRHELAAIRAHTCVRVVLYRLFKLSLLVGLALLDKLLQAFVVTVVVVNALAH